MVNPSSFSYGSVFSTSSWQQNIRYLRKTTMRAYPFDLSEEHRNEIIPDGPQDKGCYTDCTVKIPLTVSAVGVADLSSRMTVQGKECVLLYNMKGLGEALNISVICAATTLVIELPLSIVYHALRIPISILYFIFATPIEMITCAKGGASKVFWRQFEKLGERIENSLWHIVSAPFFAIATAGAHLLVVLESLLTGYVATDPLNARKLVARIIMLWNDNKPRSQMWWSIAGPQKDFVWLSDSHSFCFPGCYLPESLGVLDQTRKKVVAIKSFSGKDVAQVEPESRQHVYNPCICYSSNKDN